MNIMYWFCKRNWCSSKRVKYSAWRVQSQGLNSKELAGVQTSGGTCKVMRKHPLILPILASKYVNVYRDISECGCILCDSLHTGVCPGVAWSSSARVVRCLVNSSNERNALSDLCELIY